MHRRRSRLWRNSVRSWRSTQCAIPPKSRSTEGRRDKRSWWPASRKAAPCKTLRDYITSMRLNAPTSSPPGRARVLAGEGVMHATGERRGSGGTPDQMSRRSEGQHGTASPPGATVQLLCSCRCRSCMVAPKSAVTDPKLRLFQVLAARVRCSTRLLDDPVRFVRASIERSDQPLRNGLAGRQRVRRLGKGSQGRSSRALRRIVPETFRRSAGAAKKKRRACASHHQFISATGA